MQKKDNTRKIVVRKTSDKPRSIRIPIIGTVGDDGIKLKPEFDEEDENARVLREARTVAAFLNGGPPDFLMQAMLTAIDDAFEHVGIPIPGSVGFHDDYDEENLQPLFLKTNLTSWNDLWTDGNRVLDAMSELLHNPETPSDLFQAVSEFVTDQSNVDAEKIFHSDPVLIQILESVPPEERMGAVQAAREAKDGGAQ